MQSPQAAVASECLCHLVGTVRLGKTLGSTPRAWGRLTVATFPKEEQKYHRLDPSQCEYRKRR